MLGHVALMGSKPEGRRLLERRRRRWEYNIKMDIKISCCEGVDGIDVA